jgi:hypothetical protein
MEQQSLASCDGVFLPFKTRAQSPPHHPVRSQFASRRVQPLVAVAMGVAGVAIDDNDGGG